jgi:alpha-beta hydrolase superfamily lysophospholipase
MKLLPLVLTTIFVLLSSTTTKAFDKTISLIAKDGTEVTAYWFDSTRLNKNSKTLNTVILFHQAGASALGEYQEIIPKLTVKGLNVLAVDLRSGGDRFGGNNTTASAFEERVPYCEALPDMQASVDWVKAKDPATQIIVWGSSYSAGAVFRIASENQKSVNGVMAFSPASGESMKKCNPEPYLEKISVPAIAFRPSTELARAKIIKQRDIFEQHQIKYVKITDGVHGSSMLLRSRTNSDMSHAWKEVFTFLEPWTK